MALSCGDALASSADFSRVPDVRRPGDGPESDLQVARLAGLVRVDARVRRSGWLPPARCDEITGLDSLISEAAAGFGRSPLLWFGALGSDVRTIL